MSDRLPSENDICDVHPWMAMPEGDDPDNDMNTHKATALAQCAHTERRWATRMADWLQEWCDNGMHSEEEQRVARAACPDCIDWLIARGREGKAPTPSGQWPEGE